MDRRNHGLGSVDPISCRELTAAQRGRFTRLLSDPHRALRGRPTAPLR